MAHHCYGVSLYSGPLPSADTPPGYLEHLVKWDSGSQVALVSGYPFPQHQIPMSGTSAPDAGESPRPHTPEYPPPIQEAAARPPSRIPPKRIQHLSLLSMEDGMDPTPLGTYPTQMQLVIQYSECRKGPIHRALILGGKLGQYVCRVCSG